MRMPFRHHEPSRVERVRCAVQGRAADAAHTLSGAASSAAGAAQGAAMSAAGAAHDAAYVVADRANLAAHDVAGRATVAAGAMAERARPLAAEAAARCGAAWRVIRYGAPRPSPMTRMTSLVPVAAVTTVARRGKAPIALMVLGAAGAVGFLWLRRARMDRDSVWILDDDSDVEPVGRWSEDDARADRADMGDLGMDGRDHGRRAGRMERGGPQDSASSDRRDSPANRWP